MRVIIEPTADQGSQRAAAMVAQLIRKKPRAVLGLATGGTPLRLYQELIRMHQTEGLDFSRVVSFNLDEYVGLPPTHPQSYRHFMTESLFRHINIDIRNTHVPDGRALDYDTYGAQYEASIAEAGGIDMQILGIGRDGHIAFNEPGSSLGSRTRLKTLAPETIRDNARFFGGEEEVPRLAITMGVGTILESKKCIMLAFGKEKAEAIAAMIEGPVTAQVTGSALQFHQDVVVILDEESASQLTRREYYDEVEEAHRRLQSEKTN
ncbi:glucosamine-6-phosphate deaminase [Bremerella cremea]|uniref:Glucosamine-6-phosphate deaminase n=1 Tax=Bremerella cremea TaxID=1031537 RepID=A0A368KU29_9BACT|nr:glucosamine-6-phosphate deaminase [Bremerella cremea]RCS53933.1 glucosamine-6-phosphate deaminase [Bremerella cremea]